MIRRDIPKEYANTVNFQHYMIQFLGWIRETSKRFSEILLPNTIDLNSIPFAQRISIQSKMHDDDSEFSDDKHHSNPDPSSYSQDRWSKRQPVPKRSNKNWWDQHCVWILTHESPMEITSKRPVTRKRQVVDVVKTVSSQLIAHIEEWSWSSIWSHVWTLKRRSVQKSIYICWWIEISRNKSDEVGCTQNQRSWGEAKVTSATYSTGHYPYVMPIVLGEPRTLRKNDSRTSIHQTRMEEVRTCTSQAGENSVLLEEM